MFVLAQKLKLCRHRLVQWQQTSKSNSKAEIEEILKKIEELRETGINGGIEVEELENMLENAYGREESYWKEKSRIKWLKEGDKNTKFFHQSFQSRVRRNKIWKLERNDRSFATSRADIALVAEDYFRDIFSSTNSTDPEGEFEDFLPKVSSAMNRRLLRPVSLDEVKRAVFSVHSESAPGDDGFTAKFFHYYWDIVTGDVFRAVRSFFIGGRILRSFNHTQICLIPKVSNAINMTQLGFDPRWIGWIQEVVTTVSYSVVVEEGLSFLLNKAEQNRLISGIQINRRCPPINHLLFADDSILFSRASEDGCYNILKILTLYESFSGQKVNLSKSAVFFSNNTPGKMRTALANRLNIRHIGAQDKYLGLPSTVNRSKKETFGAIKEKVREKIQGWKRHLLSTSGRHVLIKAVGEAIPIYTLSYFRLPDTLICEIHSILTQFWWGQKGTERKMAWISWDTMSRPKKEGGLGFKDLRAQNLALLAKQCWKLATQPQSLLSKIFKGKYYRYSNIMRAETGNQPSWGWRSLLEGRKVLEKGICWRVGNGNSIRVSQDPWVATSQSFLVSHSSVISNQNLEVPWVNELIMPSKQ
ncbi:uncharacterized protein LOC107495706 [Arachis duranensis]|uniref:Uncharacterized protein LOC107495706 n=1 Tax=Arachis duranensis TaxID=130453 RepID=A0A6P4DU97_ARADU|nr:uncharacterized protein LOC107495706 [Arachis duranensis]